MDKTQKLMARVAAASAMLLAAGCSQRNNCDPRIDPGCTNGGGYSSGSHYYGGGGSVHSSGGWGGFGGFGGSHGGVGG